MNRRILATPLVGVDRSVQSVVKGLVLLLAVAFGIYNICRAGATR